MDNRRQIQQLRDLIYSSLDPLIDDDYCLLDVPNHINVGDQLIWQGEKDYLKRLPFNILYEASLNYFSYKKIPKKGIILLHGGGNFGDLWSGPPSFRRKIIEIYKDRKIIIFPQTVFYKNDTNLKNDALVYSQHPNLTICVRDAVSYQIIKHNFPKNNVLLLPDMAFCSDYSKFILDGEVNNVLYLERLDVELNEKKKYLLNTIYKIEAKRNVVVGDWPTFEYDKKNNENFLYKVANYIKYNFEKTALPILHKIPGIIDPVYGFSKRDLKAEYIKDGIKFINQFDTIYTTRLHGAILSILLAKKVKIIDNTYGKNGNFYNAWLSDLEEVEMMKD